MTLREAFQQFYDCSELSKSTVAKHGYSIQVFERLTGNPPVDKIDNAVLAKFRAAMIDSGKAPNGINTVWISIRAILRRIGPACPGNPFGAGIISTFPAMKPVKVIRGAPRIISLEDLAKVYIAARKMELPRRRSDVHPADWWRALLTVGYFTGLRRGAIWCMQWEDVDLTAGTLATTSTKTAKSDLFPLHEVAVDHLARIKGVRSGRVFRGLFNSGNGSYYKLFHGLQDLAGVSHFGLHDLRRTAATQIEGVAPGMGPTLLQHTARSVSDIHYIRRSVHLRSAIEKMPIPVGWKSGVKVNAKREAEQRQQLMQLHREDFVIPNGPVPGDWAFRPGQFAYKGVWYSMPSPTRLALLECLTRSLEPVPLAKLIDVVNACGRDSVLDDWQRVQINISAIRMRLRKILGLGNRDPLPCTERGRGGAWTVNIA